MIKPILYSLFLILTTFAVYSSRVYAEGPTLPEVQRAVDEIVKKLDDFIEEQAVPNSKEIFWRAQHCYEVSRIFADKLNEMGFQPFLQFGNTHGFLSIKIINSSGKHEEVVIDPTYRQWYVDRRFVSSTRSIEQVFDIFKMPKVLVVEKRKLKETIFGFPIKPVWGSKEKAMLKFENVYKKNIKFSSDLSDMEIAWTVLRINVDYLGGQKIKMRLMLAELFD